MNYLIHWLIGLAAAVSMAGTAHAWPVFENSEVTVCPASGSMEQPPDFDGLECRTVRLLDLDPQESDLWIRRTVVVPDVIDLSQPRAFLLSGKFSARVWLNGTWIGDKGTPGPDATAEVAGPMDTRLLIPLGALEAGENSIVIRMSSHHNLLQLVMPIHGLSFAGTDTPANSILRHYWTTLLPFGALLIASLYLLALVLIHRHDNNSREQGGTGTLALSLMALFATAQLFTEVARGTMGYPYPWHDYRLLIIVACSAGFGLSLLSHVIAQLGPQRFDRSIWWTSAGAVALACAFAPGYDIKAALAILVPVLVGLLVCLRDLAAKRPLAGRYLLVMALFCGVITLAPSAFLDRYFFYVTAGLLAFMVIQQARIFSRNRRELLDQRARADRLQLIVEREAQQRDPGHVDARSVGKVQRVAIADIAFCQGAGDYVELHLVDGTRILHHDTLLELESRLPAIFLRVHRSYLVNTDRIKTLKRLPNGSGELILDTNQRVPVSRRIMPDVRRGLVGHASFLE